MFDFRRRCAHGHEGVRAQPAVDEGAHLEAGAALGGHRRHQRRDEGAQTHRLQGANQLVLFERSKRLNRADQIRISLLRNALFQGKYLVFFFYPLDFTFVCPTEILAFNDRVAEFKALGAEVRGGFIWNVIRRG